MFLHLDKTVYTGNEIIWFTGYLLNFRKEDINTYTTLYVSISDPVKRKTVVASRFVVENGLAQGVLQIPDSFPAGEYALVAYTDHLFSHPDDAIFQQWISVRYNTSPTIPFYQHPKDSTEEEPASPVKVLLNPDSSRYHRRSMTHWTVRLTDRNNRPVRGLFSVACVRKTRLIGREADIRQYGQTCFIIPDLLKEPIPPITVHVGYDNKKRLKAATQLLIAGDQSFQVVTTEKDGSLSMNPALLKGAYGTDILLSVVNKKDQEFYHIAIDENDRVVNQLLSLRSWPLIISPLHPKEIFTPEEKEEDKTMLAQAVVKGRSKPDYMRPEYFELPVMNGPCAAWVCSCGHWKCLSCPPERKPVKGWKYEERDSHRVITYNGCPLDTVRFVKKIKAVNYPRAFEAPDFGKEHGSGNFFNTTLYWNYLVLTDDNGQASFSFYTNDLSGTFSCIIQGVSSAGMISAVSEVKVQDE